MYIFKRTFRQINAARLQISTLRYAYALFVLLLTATATGYAQGLQEKPRKSPVGLTALCTADLYIKVTYGRPSIAHDRETVFGTKVPYRRLWRTGDDEATEITLSDTVDILGTTVAPGTYSLITVPDTAEWTVILNRDVGLWGIYKYNPAQNILETSVPLHRSPKTFLRFSVFLEETAYGADLLLLWHFSAVRIPIRRT